MNGPVIAYYLHSRRPEAVDRARAIVAALGDDAVVLSARPAPLGWRTAWSALADDSAGALAAWLAAYEPDGVVVDGPAGHLVATAGGGRLVAAVARPDEPHAGALELADLLLVPGVEDPLGDLVADERVVHLGAVGAAAARAVAARPERVQLRDRGPLRCVSIAPNASGPGPRERREILAATPTWQWWFAGERDLLDDGPVWDLLLRANVLVCAATPTNIAAAAAAQVATVLVVPEHAPAAEHVLAESARLSAPVIVTGRPQQHQWRTLLAYAHGLDGRGWSAWSSHVGLDRLRRLVSDAAAPDPQLIREGRGHVQGRRDDVVRRPLLDV